VVKCDRCGDDTSMTTMSIFNRDTICPPCKLEEKEAPNYRRAVDTEASAVRCGDYNFSGIGLAAEDLTFLAQRRRCRQNRS
jgi:hypothetical protein